MNTKVNTEKDNLITRLFVPIDLFQVKYLFYNSNNDTLFHNLSSFLKKLHYFILMYEQIYTILPEPLTYP